MANATANDSGDPPNHSSVGVSELGLVARA